MGQEVQGNSYSEKDFERFKDKLDLELSTLKTWFDEKRFSSDLPMIGIELEGWFANSNCLPSLHGYDTIKKFNHPLVVPEISRFNFEINSNPYNYAKNCFYLLLEELEDIWKNLQKATKEDSCFFIGTLPTLRDHMLSLDIMTPHNRYSVMNKQVMKFRGNKPLKLHIEGKDKLDLSMDSVIAECAATSLQIHLGVTQENAARYYNASIAASSFLVAVSANSPYLFGKELWDESRIMGFEQSVELECDSSRTQKKLERVTLGSDYVKDSLFELFEESVVDYPPLLPEKFDDPTEKLSHLRFHNGTIWRWTRPIIGVGDKPHLRIEQRTPSSGPTVIDSIANTVFFLGLTDYLANLDEDISRLICFNDAKENFYKAAKQSFYCKVVWIDGEEYNMQELILNTLLPNIEKELYKRGINKQDIDLYINDIIKNRVKKGVNGAIWQKAYIHMHGKRFQEMTEAYIRNQKKNLPVHLWSLDR